MPCTVDLVCIGNELLTGHTLNTNAHWLCRRLTELGAYVTRISTVHDDVDQMTSVIREAIRRRPDFIITTGGLGPTFDDRTLEALGRALNRKVAVNLQAMRLLKRHYARLQRNVAMTPPRIKMATIPERTEALPNPVGTAPGVLAKKGNTRIFVLPGVPQEMEAMFEGSVAPRVKREIGRERFYERSLKLSGLPESEIAPVIDRVMKRFPKVFIKSHPRGWATRRRPLLELQLSCWMNQKKSAKWLLDSAMSILLKEVAMHQRNS